MTRYYRATMLALSCLLFALGSVLVQAGQGVVPDRERSMAQENGVTGPAESRGIESVVRLGSVSLGSEFSAMEGKELRVREITILPGGVIPVHRHEGRPGVAYILEGEIIEHRNDADGPVRRTKGDAAFEQTGVIHWWENQSKARVRALVVDIADIE